MPKTRRRLKGNQRMLQARPRLRILQILHPPAYQVHVVDAIRRNRVIDKDDLYNLTLKDLQHGSNSSVFAEVSTFIEGVVTGKLKGMEFDAAERTMSGADRLDEDDGSYTNIAEFNKRFLNGKGLHALVAVLVTDAANLDLAAIDTFRGGEALTAAYGPRWTRRHKTIGSRIQNRLKKLPAIDEPAVREAADRYVVYRFLDGGSLPNYKRRAELAGNPRGDRYLRKWFRRFEQSLGYPPPIQGRPRNKRIRAR